MLTNIFFKKSKFVGLDIGSKAIKIAQVVDSKTGYELVYYDTIAVPPETIKEGSVINKDNLIAVLVEATKKGNLYNANVAVGISGHSSVMIKKIKLPMMTEEELMESIRYEAEQYIPFDINDVNIDFQIIGPNPEEENQMDVLLVAVKKNLVNEIVDCVDKADMDVVIVDIESFALCNSYEANYDLQEEDYVALIDIGYTKGLMNIILKDVPVFTRDINIGTVTVENALCNRFSISKEDATRLMHGRAVEGIEEAEANELILSAVDDIADELRMTFDFFRSTFGYVTISTLLLSGGSALIKGFTERMSERLGIKIVPFAPFTKIAISDKLDKNYIESIAPSTTIAVGLALRREDDR